MRSRLLRPGGCFVALGSKQLQHHRPRSTPFFKTGTSFASPIASVLPIMSRSFSVASLNTSSTLGRGAPNIADDK